MAFTIDRYIERRPKEELVPRPQGWLEDRALPWGSSEEDSVNMLLRSLLSDHYDVEVVGIVDCLVDGKPPDSFCGEYLLVIYDKGGTVPRVTFLVAQ